MGAFTDKIVAEGTKIYALVKLDDYATTRSTGGVVDRVYWVLPRDPSEDPSVRPENWDAPWKNDYVMDDSKYKAVEVTDHESLVTQGFIYADKTGVIRDPNS